LPLLSTTNFLKNKKTLYILLLPTRDIHYMNIIRECILEYRLTYMGERLFGNSVIKSHIKSLKEMTKCFIDLITPTKDIDIDF